MRKRFIKKSVIVMISLALTACASNTYLAKQQYMLQANQPILKTAQPINATLTVEPTLASPPYDNVQFIYRLKNSQYLTDYYNIFMTEPATQVTAALTGFLQQTNLFSNVNSADMILPANYNLKTQLVQLYADYTDDAHPKAVMEVQFILLNGSQIVLQTMLAAYVPLAQKSTESLVTGWNQDLNIILTKFSLKLMQQFHLKQASGVQVQTIVPVQTTAPTQTTTPAPNNNFLTLAPPPPVAAAPAKPAAKTTLAAPSDNDEHGFLRLY